MIKKLYKKIVTEKKRIEIIEFKNNLLGYFLKGTNYKCNLCENTFRQLLDKGNGINIRANAECPICSSLERTRLLFFYLQDNTTIFKSNPSVLHISPERSLKTKFKSNPNYYDIDINPNLAKYREDLTCLTFENNKFDYIICSHVLGHIKSEETAIKEIHRVLKNEGEAYILTLINLNSYDTFERNGPQTEIQRLNDYGEKDLERLHGLDFKLRLENEGFKVEQIDYRKHFSEKEIQYFSLGNGQRELIFKCTKR